MAENPCKAAIKELKGVWPAERRYIQFHVRTDDPAAAVRIHLKTTEEHLAAGYKPVITYVGKLVDLQLKSFMPNPDDYLTVSHVPILLDLKMPPDLLLTVGIPMIPGMEEGRSE